MTTTRPNFLRRHPDMAPEFLRDDAGQVVRINGYASLFGAEGQINGQIVSFDPGAFAPSLRYGANVRATLDHRYGATFARVRDRSLMLWQDCVGLAFSIAVPASTEGRGIARAVADGEIGASVLFRPFQRRKAAGVYVVERTVLTDVCLTTSPVYRTAAWLSPFELMNHMHDRALLLRRCWVGGALKGKREARGHVTQPRVVPSKARQAAKAHQEANDRRPLHARKLRRVA